ncbi:MAG: HAMP domain-containing sensor histidine kinase [Bacteroidota bacterium]
MSRNNSGMFTLPERDIAPAKGYNPKNKADAYWAEPGAKYHSEAKISAGTEKAGKAGHKVTSPHVKPAENIIGPVAVSPSGPLRYCDRIDSLKALLAHVSPNEPYFITTCCKISAFSQSCRDMDDTVYSARRAYFLSLGHRNNLLLRAEVLAVYVRALINSGRPDSAAHYTDSLEQIARITFSGDLMGQVQFRRGLISMRLGSYHDALNRLNAAVPLLSKAGNLTELQRTYKAIGIVSGYILPGNATEEYQKKSLELCLKTGNIMGQAVALGNLAELAIQRKEYDKALGLIRRSAVCYEKAGVYPPADVTTLDMAYVQSLQKHFGPALKSAEEFEKTMNRYWAKSEKRIYIVSENYSRLSKIYMSAGKSDKALEMAYKALNLMKPVQEAADLIQFYFNISEIYDKRNELDKAMAYRDTSYNLRVRVRESEHRRAVAEAETKYKNAEKQKQIDEYKRRNRLHELELEKEKSYRTFFSLIAALLLVIIFMVVVLYKRRQALTVRLKDQFRAENERNAALKELNETKDRFFTLIAHDLRAPVIGFRALPGLYDRCLRNNDKKMISELNKVFAGSVSNMLGMLDSLLSWAQLQKGKMPYMPELTGLRAHVQESMEVMQGSAFLKQVSLVNKTDPAAEACFDRKAIATALRNLIAHSIRHSESGSEVAIRSRSIPGFAVIEIDAGLTGLSHATAEALNRGDVPAFEPGSREEKGSTLGLLLALDFIRQNRGELHVERDGSNAKQPGNIFVISLPDQMPADADIIPAESRAAAGMV